MTSTRRAWRLPIATALSGALLGTGITAGALSQGPAAASSPPAVASSPQASAGPAASITIKSYAPVVRQVVPSVVLIRTPGGLGSGVILDGKGNIVTNAHVTGNAARFQIQLADDPAPRSARLVTEPATQESPGATLPGAIQTSAPINPGNSGGALVNLSGQVIGIPTLAAASPVNGTPAPGIGFAIPSNVVRDIAGQIVASGRVTDSRRAALGVQIATIDGTAGYPSGAGVVAVTPGGPADRAGLRAGDVIRSAGPKPTPSAEALSQALAAMRPGQTITVAIIRGRQPLTVPVTLGQLAVARVRPP